MSSHRIQFQPGMSIPESRICFGAEAPKLARWPQGFGCPRFGRAPHYVGGQGAHKLFRCNGCRHRTSPVAGTRVHTASCRRRHRFDLRSLVANLIVDVARTPTAKDKSSETGMLRHVSNRGA